MIKKLLKITIKKLKKLKKVIFIIAILVVGVGIGASSFQNSITSDGHRTYQISAMQINEKEHLDLNVSQVVFTPMDSGDAMYGSCDGECLEAELNFETNDNLDLNYELIVYLDGERWHNHLFDVQFKRDNSIMSSLSLASGEHDIEVKIWLTDELGFEQMGKDVELELRFWQE